MAAKGGYTRLQPLTHESSTTAGTKLRSCRIQLRRGAALARIGSGRRRAGKDRRLMIPTLCVRNQIRHSTLISGTQRMGHPQYAGGKETNKGSMGTAILSLLALVADFCMFLDSLLQFKFVLSERKSHLTPFCAGHHFPLSFEFTPSFFTPLKFFFKLCHASYRLCSCSVGKLHRVFARSAFLSLRACFRSIGKL